MALAVFALIGAAAYRGLGAVLDSRAAVDAELERLREIQLALALFGNDVSQAVPRPVRDEFGLSRPALLGGDDAVALLSLTRTGWDNPLAQPRSVLQRLQYSFRHGELWRRYWPTLDRGGRGEPLETVVLSRLQAVRVRFLDAGGRWSDRWPPVAGADERLLPRALELSLEFPDWGRLVRLWRLPDGR